MLGSVRGAQRVLFGCPRWGLGGTSPSGCPPGPLFAISSWRSKIWWALGEPGWDVRAGLQPPRAIITLVPCTREKGTSAPRTGRRRGQRTLTLSCRVLVEVKAPRTDRTDRTGQDGQDRTGWTGQPARCTTDHCPTQHPPCSTTRVTTGAAPPGFCSLLPTPPPRSALPVVLQRGNLQPCSFFFFFSVFQCTCAMAGPSWGWRRCRRAPGAGGAGREVPGAAGTMPAAARGARVRIV